MGSNNATYSADDISEQWERFRTVEMIARRQVLSEKRQLAMMIARRTCSLQDIADRVDVSRAYPGQLADRYTQGLYDVQLAALDAEVSA